MTRSLQDRNLDHEVLMHMVVELARAAAESASLDDDVVELIEDFERRLAVALGVTGEPYHG